MGCQVSLQVVPCVRVRAPFPRVCESMGRQAAVASMVWQVRGMSRRGSACRPISIKALLLCELHLSPLTASTLSGESRRPSSVESAHTLSFLFSLFSAHLPTHAVVAASLVLSVVHCSCLCLRSKKVPFAVDSRIVRCPV